MRTATLSLLLLTTAACSSTQRAVGASMAGAGMVATYVGLAMAPSCRQRSEPHQACVDQSDSAASNVGVPLVFGGLGAVVLGGVIMATAGDRAELPPAEPPTTPRVSEKVPKLAEAEAVGMAVGQLVFDGFELSAKPGKLLSVDDTQSHLQIQRRRAVLWNLRVRSALDEDWRVVGACYEYDSQWQLTSLGTIPECMRQSPGIVGTAALPCNETDQGSFAGGEHRRCEHGQLSQGRKR